MSNTKINCDRDANALYVKIHEGKVVNTLPLGEGSFLDISEDGKPIGLEIIFPRSTPQEAIDAILGMEKSTKFFSNVVPNLIDPQLLAR